MNISDFFKLGRPKLSRSAKKVMESLISDVIIDTSADGVYHDIMVVLSPDNLRMRFDRRYCLPDIALYKKYIGRSVDDLFGATKTPVDSLTRDLVDLLRRVLINCELDKLTDTPTDEYYHDYPINNPLIACTVDYIMIVLYPDGYLDIDTAEMLSRTPECFTVNYDKGYVYSKVIPKKKLYYWNMADIER